jgi:hypothetical protein
VTIVPPIFYHAVVLFAGAENSTDHLFLRFRKLAGCEIDPEVKRVLVTAFYSQMATAESKQEATCLLQAADRHPRRTTLAALDARCNLIVDGPFQPEQTRATLYRAFSALDGTPKIIKFSQCACDEMAVFASLGLSPDDARRNFIVPLEFLDVSSFSGRGVTGSALVMPAFVCSLDAIPHASVDMVLRGVKNIVRALSVLHAKEWTHMDVKPDNILVSETGDWHLTDYDSCSRAGARAVKVTPSYIPRGFSREPRPNFDFVLLCVTAIFVMDPRWLPVNFNMVELQRCVDGLGECDTLRNFPHDTSRMPELKSVLRDLLMRS